MNPRLKKALKVALTGLVCLALILDLPDIVKAIFECGREFGYNVMSAILEFTA